MTTLQQWAMDNYLTEAECDAALLTFRGIGHINVITARKKYIAETLAEATEQAIKEENLLPAKVEVFEVTDFDTLTLKGVTDGE